MSLSPELPRSKEEKFRDALRSFRTGNMPDISEQIALFDYRMQTRRELERQLNGEFFISPDISTNKEMLIPSVQNGGLAFVDIRLDPEALIPFLELNPYALAVAKTHTRSRFAQIGLEVPQDAATDIAKTFHYTQDTNGKKEYHASIPVMNHAARPILVPKGTKFFNIYYWDDKTITGEELQDLIGKHIHISGIENKTWRWWYGPKGERKKENIQGIEFFIDPESRSYIPASDEPILLDDGSALNHNRSGADKYLVKPIPRSALPFHWTADTLAEILIDERYHGLVDMAVARAGLPIGQDRNHSFQSNSLIIQGGNTYGRMRVEIISPTSDEIIIPKTSLLRVAQAHKKTA